MADRVERACEVMHDAYERAAVGAGWETNPASLKPWADVPEANKVAMRAAVSALMAGWDAEQAAMRAEVERLREAVADYEHRITWDTTCKNCANILDSSIKETERAEAAEAKVAAFEALADEWERPVEYTGPAEAAWAIAWHQTFNTARAWAASQLRAVLSGSSEPTKDRKNPYGVSFIDVTINGVEVKIVEYDGPTSASENSNG